MEMVLKWGGIILLGFVTAELIGHMFVSGWADVNRDDDDEGEL